MCDIAYTAAWLPTTQLASNSILLSDVKKIECTYSGVLAMARREKKFRQTFPGPNSSDNQQMLHNIRETLENHQRETSIERPMSKEGPERPDTRDRDQTRRSSPPSELTASGSPGTTPRMQQNRSTPTKLIATSRTKKQLAKIRKSLKPFAYSDPGFHAAKDKVNKRMLEELISLGHNEVGQTNVLVIK